MPMPDHEELRNAVVEGDVERARALARALVEGRSDLVAAVEQGFAAGIRRVGELWEEGEYFLPELVQGAEAMKAAMEIVRPALSREQLREETRGRVVIGTVQGDLHDIGKGLVAALLSAHGYEVHDLGSDVPVSAFLRTARETGAAIVAASALLTTTMLVQRDLAEAVRAAGLPAQVLIGGAPTSPGWADEIGAFHAENALQAVQVAAKMLGARR